MKHIKKIGIVLLALLLTVLCACSAKNDDFNDKTFVVTGNFPSAQYLELLANNNYYLEFSMFTGALIIQNSVAQRDGVIESRSVLMDSMALESESVSHTMSKNGETYFLDDKHMVKFLANTADGEGLANAVDYSTAEYIGSGNDTLMFGKSYAYDEFSCKTVDGGDSVLRLYMSDNSRLVAIVDTIAEVSYERDVSVLTSEIPDGWLEDFDKYETVDEQTYFKEYYKK